MGKKELFKFDFYFKKGFFLFEFLLNLLLISIFFGIFWVNLSSVFQYYDSARNIANNVLIASSMIEFQDQQEKTAYLTDKAHTVIIERTAYATIEAIDYQFIIKKISIATINRSKPVRLVSFYEQI